MNLIHHHPEKYLIMDHGILLISRARAPVQSNIEKESTLLTHIMFHIPRLSMEITVSLFLGYVSVGNLFMLNVYIPLRQNNPT